MQIKRLGLSKYRTFEELEINFPNFYTAICGQNDAGKSNVIKALQVLLGDDEPYYYRRRFSNDLALVSDYPKWLSSDDRKSICISCDLSVHREYDAGLYSFLNEWLELDTNDTELVLKLQSSISEDQTATEIKVITKDKEFSGLKAQEVQKRLKSTLLIHNSTEAGYRFSYIGQLDEFSTDYGAELAEIGKKASNSLKKVAKAHKDEISRLLGRLSRTYKVEISLPDISLNHLPYDLTLGDSKIDVALSEWGSGTKNRTMIFLALLKARQVSQSATTSAKVTPVLVIEEPESFLHPSAQAEFGRILQDLSSEFGVQVISTTHSPYMLSKENPVSNILLERKLFRGHFRGSQQVQTSDEHWMEPFSRILGLSSDEFKPWKDLFFGNNESTLLVEGAIDKEYFEMLRSDEHGSNKLDFEGNIFDYDGFGSLKSPTLLKFINNRSKSAFITYDLDVEGEIKPGLEKNGFLHKENFLGLGINKPGMRSVEGLLPRDLVADVNSERPELVQQAMYGTKEEQRSAKNSLKGHYLQKFREKCQPNEDWFGEFYKVVKIINAGLSRK